MKKFKGAITAIVTPFDAKGEIEEKSFRNLVEFQIKEGINAIVVCGSTGEAATMERDEYEKAVSIVVSEVKKRVPVIAGAGSNDTKKAIELSKIAKSQGVDALLHVTPYYNKPTPTGLVAHFKAIAENSNLPVILYNVPGRTGQNVLPQTILKVAKEVPQVIGVKEASGSITQMMELVKNRPSYLSVLSGDDSLTFPLMSLGGDGCISVVSNEIPKEFSQMTAFALDKNWDKARKLHYLWLDLMDANFIETNPIPVKTALFLMGKIKESFRLPLVKMDEKNKEKLKAVLKSHGLIKK